MRAPTVGRKLYSALMFVLVSVLGGVLVAGLAVPTAGIGAELAKVSAVALQAIPKDIETPPPAEGSTVLMADGTVLTNFFDENRAYVPLSEISPAMKQAQLAVEDQRFYAHGALDFRGTLRALVRTSSGNTQGGSTLTQQYVKLALIDKAVNDNDKDALAAAYDRNFSRKLLELRYAIALEERLSKDEILERYLNLSYYGAGAYGVEAAAKRYFNVSAKELTLPQAAMLAGLVRNPATTDPIRYEKIALERRNNVLDVMLSQAGTPDVWHFMEPVTKAQVAEAKAIGFDRSLVTDTPHGCVSSEFQNLCSVVESILLTMPSLGPDVESRRKAVYRGGLTIQTEIDPRTQRAAQKAVSDYVYPTDPVVGLMVMIEPGTGLIKGMAQSRPNIGNNPGETYLNYAMEKSIGGTNGFFGGSTYKVFTLAAAIAKGFPTDRTYDAPKTKNWYGETFRNCDGPFQQLGLQAGKKQWVVNNAGSGGEFDMYSGTKSSVNNFFVALLQDVGVCEAVQMAETLGLKLQGKTLEQAASTPAFTLGTAESSPISLANAYATLAARGMRCDPILLKSVVNKAGKSFEVPPANCQQVIPQEVADRVNDVMRGPFNGGTASTSRISGYNLAGKTGTDGSDTKAIWLVGYTPNLAGAAMIGVDRDHERFKGMKYESLRLQNLPIRDGKYRLRGSSGREAGRGIWYPAMSAALEGMERLDFVKPTKVEQPIVDVPSCSGKGLNECRQTLQQAGFGTAITRVENARPAGTFLGIRPSGRAERFSTIRLLVSSGPAPKPEPKPEPKPSSAPPTSAPPAQAPPVEPSSEPAPGQPGRGKP
ncbi:penicillin-binding protein [Propioniciclava sinopodophylli]|uniref:Penicillin-binding protein n=1 Tax=Propioniciclava sinopodophylli TaxID=1837344 RepID=A0A4Q9KH14_9ACTN|nr:transglycosylase domain-containing protein [Propioniciclava sinopodophylli]TBT88581.1 penicillin-binding protein [Propioniciclava sinopodophylli]